MEKWVEGKLNKAIMYSLFANFLPIFDDFSKWSVYSCGAYWKHFRTLKNHQIRGKWWIAFFNLPSTHFSADSRYPKIRFMVSVPPLLVLSKFIELDIVNRIINLHACDFVCTVLLASDKFEKIKKIHSQYNFNNIKLTTQRRPKCFYKNLKKVLFSIIYHRL